MTTSSDQAQLRQQYRNNFPRHLIALSRYLQSETMHNLQIEGGHTALRLSFEPFISLIVDRDYRLTDLAELLAISKQACNQTANQIEKAGYIKRIPDPEDGRAKMITLTDKGRALTLEGAEAIARTLQGFENTLGKESLQTLTQGIADLARGLKLPQSDNTHNPVPLQLSTLTPRCADYVMRELMHMTIAKGHPGLKMSHGAVLTLIGINGGRIQQIARIQDVSKQAISAIAKDLEQLGYIQREADSNDTRQSLLKLSPKGHKMIADSVAAISELDQQFSAIIGSDQLDEVKTLCKQLFDSLALETDQESSSSQDLQALAQQLKDQLGASAARQLGALLCK